jgi:hypothetical protein
MAEHVVWTTKMDAPCNQYQGLRTLKTSSMQLCRVLQAMQQPAHTDFFCCRLGQMRCHEQRDLHPWIVAVLCVLLQTVAQHVAQMDYMRHAMKTKDGEIEVLKKKWQEYQDVQDRLSGYEKDRLGEKDLLRKRAEQIDALQHKVTT